MVIEIVDQLAILLLQPKEGSSPVGVNLSGSHLSSIQHNRFAYFARRIAEGPDGRVLAKTNVAAVFPRIHARSEIALLVASVYSAGVEIGALGSGHASALFARIYGTAIVVVAVDGLASAALLGIAPVLGAWVQIVAVHGRVEAFGEVLIAIAVDALVVAVLFPAVSGSSSNTLSVHAVISNNAVGFRATRFVASDGVFKVVGGFAKVVYQTLVVEIPRYFGHIHQGSDIAIAIDGG